MSSNFETLQPAVEQGDMRVLLQISDGPISGHPGLRGAPWLGGPRGWAARRAAELGRDAWRAMSDASALIDLLGAGIVVSAPKGLPLELAACLRARIHDAASSPGFRSAVQAAGRTLDVAPGERAEADLSAAEHHAARLAPIVREAFRRVRK
jgi:hypothetical protein